tara:strand:+ start:367 stop:1275 length:909 start_codon:yes stop_codon:yes gene_type:complete
MLKKQYFILILICNFIYSNESSFDLINLIEKSKAYFSIHVSADGSSVAITNANYSQLYIANNGYFKNVDMKNINAFHCKWSPNGEKLMVMRSSFENRRRLNSLIVLNKYGNLLEIVVDFSSQRILPVGWTGNNTLHFLLDDQLITRNMNKSENEWDLPLIFATKNKLYKKISDEKVQLLHQAQDMILNLSYSSDATLIVFEVYGNETIVIQDEKLIKTDIRNGNAPMVSPDGEKIVFMNIEDDGYQIQSGSISYWDSKTSKIYSIIDDPKMIAMNPVWGNNNLIYYINFSDGSIQSRGLKNQ